MIGLLTHEPLKVLSMHEPWASALVFGPKDYENRDWLPYPGTLGNWTLISSAKKWDQRNARAVLGQWLEDEPETFPEAFRAALRKQWQLSKPLRDPRLELCPYGHIIGAVRFDAAFRRGPGMLAVEVAAYTRWEDVPELKRHAEEMSSEPRSAFPWFMGSEKAPYGWRRADRLGFATPVPCRGFQKLWNPPEDVLARCRSELEEAARKKGTAL